MCVCCAKSLSCVWLFVTPRTITHQAPLSMGILQERILEWVAIPFSRDLPNPGIEPRSLALLVDSLPSEPSGKPKSTILQYKIKIKLKNTRSLFLFSDSKESTCNAGDWVSIPGLGRSPGGGHGNPLQYSCLENPHGQRSLMGYNWVTKHSTMWNRVDPMIQGCLLCVVSKSRDSSKVFTVKMNP